jgi:hypothetical protein
MPITTANFLLSRLVPLTTHLPPWQTSAALHSVHAQPVKICRVPFTLETERFGSETFDDGIEQVYHSAAFSRSIAFLLEEMTATDFPRDFKSLIKSTVDL